jgi:hypothetical protein
MQNYYNKWKMMPLAKEIMINNIELCRYTKIYRYQLFIKIYQNSFYYFILILNVKIWIITLLNNSYL